jgi:hypothetical protein
MSVGLPRPLKTSIPASARWRKEYPARCFVVAFKTVENRKVAEPDDSLRGRVEGEDFVRDGIQKLYLVHASGTGLPLWTSESNTESESSNRRAEAFRSIAQPALAANTDARNSLRPMVFSFFMVQFRHFRQD